MLKGKYIIFDLNEILYPMLLPGVEHFIKHTEIKCPGKPVSAGFFTIDGDDIFVSGASVSLGLKSKPEDALLIKKFLTS